MSISKEMEYFSKDHPWPDGEGIESLFRFYSIDLKNIDFLKCLFIHGKLFHPLPKQFNDPFECKPHFSWPTNPKMVATIRKHLIKLARSNGHTNKSAKALISNNMSKPGYIQKIILGAAHYSYSELRICSFTTSKDNLLFWSHYADSHKGFCVEFDAARLPISYAYKVRYKDEYPKVIYPSPSDATCFTPALIKSKAWEYEEEFRTIFVPEDCPLKNDGSSLILADNQIKNIYFGVDIDIKHKEEILKLVSSGPFNPGLWDANLSKTAFKLEFKKCA